MATALSATNSADAAIRNRYSFSEGESADASGRTIVDSVGGAHGTVKGAGATATAEQLSVPGGAQATAAYVDLPNGLISSLTDATFEAWYTMNATTAWTRVFEFGSRENVPNGEVPDGTNDGGAGLDYIFFAPTRGTEPNQQRAGMRNNDALFGGSEAGTVAGGESIIDLTDVAPYVPGQTGEWHVAVAFDADGGADTTPASMTLYLNGVEQGTTQTGIQLGHLNDVNNWLGRSNWAGDQSLNGSFNEFRIYDSALSDSQVAASFALGPDVVIPEPASMALLVAAGAGCLLAFRRWQRA